MSKKDAAFNLFTAIYGDTEKAREEEEKFLNKSRKMRENVICESNKILEKNHVQKKDIPRSACVKVTANTLIKTMESFETQKAVNETLPRLDAADRLLMDAARDLIHAVRVFENVKEALNETYELPESIQKRLNEAVKKAAEISGTEDFTQFSANLFAESVLYRAITDYAREKEHTLDDAVNVIAAIGARNLIVELYKGYDVLSAEDRIRDIERYNHYKKAPGLPRQLLLATMPVEARKNQELFERAAEEIDQVLNRTEELGYRLNYIRSGRTRYSVFRWKSEPESDDPDNEAYRMWAEDIGEYDTPEEAEEAANKEADDPAEVTEYDPEEMWAIVDANGHNPTNMIYPTKQRAAIFLIGLLGKEKLPNWNAWEQYLDSMKEREDA